MKKGLIGLRKEILSVGIKVIDNKNYYSSLI